MNGTAVPDDVQAFLYECIESYEQLEILLLLRNEAGARWTAEQIEARLNISPTLATDALTALWSRRLVECLANQSEALYAYASARAALDVTLGRLANAYATNPIEVIKLMSANAIRRVRTGALRAFADAFILRKDTNDG